MESKPLRSYNAIIKHTFGQALTLADQAPLSRERKRRGIAGLCQLQGPTGGGKSSSLFRSSSVDGIPAGLELINEKGYQAILVTHRWNILHDIYHNAISSTDSAGNPFTVSVLYAQDENIVSAVTRKPLPHEHSLKSGDMPDAVEALDELMQQKMLDAAEKRRLEQECRNVINLVRSVKFRNGDFRSVSKLNEYAEQELRKVCASIERHMLRVMSRLDKDVKKCKRHYPPVSE